MIKEINFENLRNINIETVDPDTLQNIEEFTINENTTPVENLKKFLEHINNPYCYKVGDFIVKENYSYSENLENKFLKCMP